MHQAHSFFNPQGVCSVGLWGFCAKTPGPVKPSLSCAVRGRKKLPRFQTGLLTKPMNKLCREQVIPTGAQFQYHKKKTLGHAPVSMERNRRHGHFQSHKHEVWRKDMAGPFFFLLLSDFYNTVAAPKRSPHRAGLTIHLSQCHCKMLTKLCLVWICFFLCCQCEEEKFSSATSATVRLWRTLLFSWP